jgi:hypothetical protein
VGVPECSSILRLGQVRHTFDQLPCAGSVGRRPCECNRFMRQRLRMQWVHAPDEQHHTSCNA